MSIVYEKLYKIESNKEKNANIELIIEEGSERFLIESYRVEEELSCKKIRYLLCSI